MPKNMHTVRIVTTDEALFASARGAVAGLDDWRITEPESVESLLSQDHQPGDVILLDAWLRTENVYESCRRLTGKTRCRTFVVTDGRNELAGEIASFCGATGTLDRPLSGDQMRTLLTGDAPAKEFPREKRGDAKRPLPQGLLEDLVGERSRRLIDVLVDPETGLFSYDYLTFKLDEEFKRAKRFEQPLSCVMLGFDGQAEDEVLRSLAGIFLQASRDTDVLGRFDQSSFLFFLPNTGPDGARVMAERIRTSAQDQGLRDLVGDPIAISVGISFCPHPEVQKREDLFSRARAAFLSAEVDGSVVVQS